MESTKPLGDDQRENTREGTQLTRTMRSKSLFGRRNVPPPCKPNANASRRCATCRSTRVWRAATDGVVHVSADRLGARFIGQATAEPPRLFLACLCCAWRRHGEPRSQIVRRAAAGCSLGRSGGGCRFSHAWFGTISWSAGRGHVFLLWLLPHWTVEFANPSIVS